MVDNLGEDDALETFYESMPGFKFYKFDIVKDFPVSSWNVHQGHHSRKSSFNTLTNVRIWLAKL
jgi:hypothetical protein